MVLSRRPGGAGRAAGAAMACARSRATGCVSASRARCLPERSSARLVSCGVVARGARARRPCRGHAAQLPALRYEAHRPRFGPALRALASPFATGEQNISLLHIWSASSDAYPPATQARGSARCWPARAA